MTMFERFRKPMSPLTVVNGYYGAMQTAAFVEPAPPKIEQQSTAAPEDALAIVKAMADLGCVFVPGRCPDTASPIWVYRAPREHAAECDRLAARVSYGAFIVAIHCLPHGSIKPGVLPPPPAR